MDTLLFVLACLVIPIAWGVLVDWLFSNWNRPGRVSQETDEEKYFPDYQI